VDSLCQAILFLIFGRSKIFVAFVGYVALGLESTLPIPQLIRYEYAIYARKELETFFIQ
jgi:hypothetical protein